MIPTKTITIEKQLKSIKGELEEIRNKRRELMFRLRSAGYTLDKIGKIYICSRQYVEKEISEYETEKA